MRRYASFHRCYCYIVTNRHNDTLADEVCAALWEMDLPYSVESEGYDDEYAAFRTILQLVVV